MGATECESLEQGLRMDRIEVVRTILVDDLGFDIFVYVGSLMCVIAIDPSR